MINVDVKTKVAQKEVAQKNWNSSSKTEVAQNLLQNLHLHKKLIKLHILNGFLC